MTGRASGAVLGASLLAVCWLALGACASSGDDVAVSRGGGASGADAAATGAAGSSGHGGVASGGGAPQGGAFGSSGVTGSGGGAVTSGGASGLGGQGGASGSGGGAIDAGSGVTSCDTRQLRCRRAAPVCDALHVPAIVSGCYGDCVPVEACACLTAEECPDSSQYTCLLSAHHCTPYLQ